MPYNNLLEMDLRARLKTALIYHFVLLHNDDYSPLSRRILTILQHFH